MVKSKIISLCSLILLVVVLIIICILDKTEDFKVQSVVASKNFPNGIFISEVMSNNEQTYIDENGNSPEYINLYNNSDEPISLEGYYISNEESNLQKCPLPNIVINPHEFYTLYSYYDGAVSTNTKFYLNFSLNPMGNNIFFSTPDKKISIVRVPSLPKDVAYSLDLNNDYANNYEYFVGGVICGANLGEHSKELSEIYEVPQYNLTITEYMTENKSKAIDNYDNTPNWIEIHNVGSEVIDLSNAVLRDNSEVSNSFTIPNGVTIQPNGYLLIWFDGLNEYTDGNLHASFKLPKNDVQLTLTDTSSNIMLQSQITYISKDVSVGYDDNLNMIYYNTPTPASENTTPAYATIEEATSLNQKQIYISEVSAFATDDDTENFDWIEIYNNSTEDINLDGWQISKKINSKSTYTFSNVTIGSGEYLLLYATGEYFDENTDYYYDEDTEEEIYLNENSIYLPFKIGVEGEKLYLFNNQGTCVDYFKSEWTSVGNTCGRVGDVDQIVFFNIPTPNGLNNTATYKGYAEMPQLSNDGGYATIGEVITADIPSGTTIYYTDDGTEPTENSSIFTGYSLNQNCVLRFLVHQDGYLPSTIYSSTYIVSENHDLPIIAISTDADGLYSEENGIFAYGYNYEDEFPYLGANFWQDWEREISFEYYSTDGEKQINCLAGAKVFGQYSRAYAQKSLAIYFRGKYGTSEIDYPFFENNEVTQFSSLVLRAGGQDQGYAHIRDAFIQEIASEYSDMASMDWQPVAVYINGEYYGCYDLREKINADYFETHENIDEDNLTLIKGDSSVLKGDRQSYKELISYINEHDLSIEENYNYVASKLDINNYIDYIITQIFAGNEDGGGNIKRYVDESGGKWRFVLYDVDMSLYQETYNSIERIFNPNGQGAIEFSIDDIQRGLIQNDTFIEQFLTRYAELLNTTFMPENLISKLDYMTGLMNNEMVLHGVRWSEPTYDDWIYNVDKLKNILQNRRDVCKEQLIDYFDLSDSKIAELFPND